MGHYNKEAYERKKEWADRKMEDIKENCPALTEDQHDTLAWLCEIRHEVHCNAKNGFWLAGDPESYWDYIYDGCNEYGVIDTRLKEVDLPIIHWDFNVDDYMTESICYALDMTEEERDKEEEKCMEMADMFNDEIEKYLKEIDQKYGTSYCPSGFARLGY